MKTRTFSNPTGETFCQDFTCLLLIKIRQKRIAELSTLNIKSVYNQVYPLQKLDWSREVTEESQKAHVFVLLTSSQGINTESRILIDVWRELARKFGDVKFCQIRGDLCIDGYPDRNTPTILVYKDGDVKKQIVTLRELKGSQTTAQGAPTPDIMSPFASATGELCIVLIEFVLTKFIEDVERLLVDVGAVKVADHRLRRSNEGTATEGRVNAKSSNIPAGDDEDDWD